MAATQTLGCDVDAQTSESDAINKLTRLAVLSYSVELDLALLQLIESSLLTKTTRIAEQTSANPASQQSSYVDN